MELLITKINGLKPLALVTKRSILDFVVVVDASLRFVLFCYIFTLIFDSIFLAFCHEKSLGKSFDRPAMLLLRGSGRIAKKVLQAALKEINFTGTKFHVYRPHFKISRITKNKEFMQFRNIWKCFN